MVGPNRQDLLDEAEYLEDRIAEINKILSAMKIIENYNDKKLDSASETGK